MERRVILEEAMGDLNETGRQINSDNIIAGLLFPGHPLGQPTVGNRAAIAQLTLRQLQRHHLTYYTPHNAVLAVAGPVEHRQVVASALQHFGRWQGGAASAYNWPSCCLAVTACMLSTCGSCGGCSVGEE